MPLLLWVSVVLSVKWDAERPFLPISGPTDLPQKVLEQSYQELLGSQGSLLLAPAHPTHSHPRWENLPQRLMLSLGESAALSSALFCLSKQHHGWGAGAPSLHFHHSYHHGKKQIGFCPCALARAALGSDGTSGFLPLSRVLLTTPALQEPYTLKGPIPILLAPRDGAHT